MRTNGLKLFAIALLLALVAVVSPGLGRPAAALSTNIVISQVYGGGGNSGAPYKADYVELFNRGASPASLNGWSVQYASSTGTSWAVANLTNTTLQPGQYYLVQMSGEGSQGVSLPTPDTSALPTIAMAAGAGKVALVDNQTALSVSCPTTGIVDFVGYGAANCSEANADAPVLTNTTAAFRNSNGCSETDNNTNDFTAAAPAPRNTSSATNVCGGGDTAPSVTGTTPTDNATNVAANSNITHLQRGGQRQRHDFGSGQQQRPAGPDPDHERQPDLHPRPGRLYRQRDGHGDGRRRPGDRPGRRRPAQQPGR